MKNFLLNSTIMVLAVNYDAKKVYKKRTCRKLHEILLYLWFSPKNVKCKGKCKNKTSILLCKLGLLSHPLITLKYEKEKKEGLKIRYGSANKMKTIRFVIRRKATPKWHDSFSWHSARLHDGYLVNLQEQAFTGGDSIW